jgi:hypothetical protein
VRGQQTADNIFLLGTELVVSPILAQRFTWISSVGHSPQYSLRDVEEVYERSTRNL